MIRRTRRALTRRLMLAEAHIARTIHESHTPTMPMLNGREPFDRTQLRAGDREPDPIGCLPHALVALVLLGAILMGILL